MIVTESLESLADNYDALVHQLDRHGVQVDQECRLPSYRDALLELIRLRAQGDQDIDLNEKGRLMDLCFEALEALTALEGAVDQAQLSPTECRAVRRIVRGPEAARDERVEAGENEPRDLAFELIVANKLRNSGMADVCLAEPDVKFRFRKRTFFVACKRPQGNQPDIERQHRAIRRLSGRANTQVADQVGPHRKNIGLAAFDISKFANPEGRGVTGRGLEDAQAQMRRRNDHFHQHFASDWESLEELRLHGVLVRFACVMVPDEPALFLHAQEWTLSATRHAGIWDRAKLRGLVNAMSL